MDSRDSKHIRFADSRDVACETIWDAASANGMHVTALNFPLMFPAPPVEGFVVPGWVPWRQLRLACRPVGLFDRLKELPDFNARELAMDIKLEEKATEGCADDDNAPWVEFHIRREQNWFEIARHLMTTEPCELTAVLFDGVDKLQHLCWPYIDCDESKWPGGWQQQTFELCRQYYRRLDRLISGLCALAGPDTTVLIASDHGFGPTSEVFHLNTWLERQGYLAWAAREENDHAVSEHSVLGVGRVARHTYLLDWEKTTAYATTPTSNGVFIAVAENGGPGLPREQYQGFRERLMTGLYAVRDGAGQQVVSYIYTREEAFQGPYGEMSPDLTLALADGGLISILRSEAVITTRRNVAGTHRPVGVFMAKGPGIRQGVELPELSILDVAPTVLYGLGLDVPSDLEGRVPEAMFEGDWLRYRPVGVKARSSEAAKAREEAAAHPALDAQDEAVVVDRLRELGYID